MYSVLLNSGRAALVNAMATQLPLQLGSFDIGVQFNFIPDPNGTSVIPDVILTQNYERLLITAVTPNEIILTALIDHDIETRIGNIMLRLTNGTPFAWFVMPGDYRKSLTDGNRPYAGERYFLHFLIDFPNIDTLLDTSNLVDYYAEFEYRSNFDTMDWPPQTSSYEQYITAHQGRQVLAHRIENRWWGMPFAQSLDDLRFHQIDGGEIGDGYFYNPLLPTWGYATTTESADKVISATKSFIKATTANSQGLDKVTSGAHIGV